MKVQVLKPGAAWNPIKQWPPNKKCFCGSLKKFKKCCRSKIPSAIDAKKAEEFRVGMKKLGYL